MRRFQTLRNRLHPTKKKLARRLARILGFWPADLNLYQLALTHSSAEPTVGLNNERLEFLGDAVISLVVTQYLYDTFPDKREGQLTELRSRMVSRYSLNEIAHRIGLHHLVESSLSHDELKKGSTPGNTFEALVGAMYLERGLAQCRTYLLQRVIERHYDMEILEKEVVNFKSLVINYAQTYSFRVEFRTLEERIQNKRKFFVMSVIVDGQQLGTGGDYNKKGAEQLASQEACQKLGLLEEQAEQEEAAT